MKEIQFRSEMTVELVDSMGSDEAVVRAARVSTKGSASKGAEANAGLINYLMRDRHGSPFEHNSFTFYVEAGTKPVFGMSLGDAELQDLLKAQVYVNREVERLNSARRP